MLDKLKFTHAYSDDGRAKATFRRCAEDFQVYEMSSCQPHPTGEHLCLQIEKREQNTTWIAKQLAIYFSVPTMNIGFAGMKDRHAVTTQWFSVYLGQSTKRWLEPKIFEQQCDNVCVKAQYLTQKKIRRGSHTSNFFTLRLTNFKGDQTLSEQRLEAIAQKGVPNYFGEQRFGINGANLSKAGAWVQAVLKKRLDKPKGIVLSAARSYLFNQVLSARVEQGNWQQVLTGDTDAQVPSGPLWGRGATLSSQQTEAIEAEVLTPLADWQYALEHSGLQQQRRSLVMLPEALRWRFEGNSLWLRFGLKPGEYATSLLMELAELDNLAQKT